MIVHYILSPPEGYYSAAKILAICNADFNRKPLALTCFLLCGKLMAFSIEKAMGQLKSVYTTSKVFDAQNSPGNPIKSDCRIISVGLEMGRWGCLIHANK